MRDNRICNFDFINAQMEHSKLEDIPSSAIADHTGFLDLGGTRAMTGELITNGNVTSSGAAIDFSSKNFTGIGTIGSGAITS
ncbi:MAG TPA: hypothetical protein ENI23_13300, partial [bacterium]|nr:hypothetical protein [bacterium]